MDNNWTFGIFLSTLRYPEMEYRIRMQEGWVLRHVHPDFFFPGWRCRGAEVQMEVEDKGAHTIRFLIET
jgi:hypothetical protein